MKNLAEQLWNSLNDDEKVQVKMLDAYFQFRSNEPTFGGKSLTPDNKCTSQIQDDLSTMMCIPDAIIVKYMYGQGFNLVPVEDGTIRWQIWRIQEGSF